MYGASPESASVLAGHIKEADGIAETVTLSKIRPENLKQPRDARGHLIIIQDLQPERYEGIVGQLLRYCVLPQVYHNLPVSFITSFVRDAYRWPLLDSGIVHHDKTRLENYLAADHLALLLYYRNFTAGVSTDNQTLCYEPLSRIASEGNLIDFGGEVVAGSAVVINDQNHCLLDNEQTTPISPGNGASCRISAYQISANRRNIANWCFQNQSGSRKTVSVDKEILNDPHQKNAVHHATGPIRVLAPAGSGKTKVLTNRIIYLIGRGVMPSSILALAFNKKAAQEMRDRLTAKNIPVSEQFDDAGAVVRTFHSLGYEIVQQALGWQYDGALNAREWWPLIEAVIKEHRIADKNFPWIEPATAAGWVTMIKNEIPEWNDLDAVIATGSDVVRAVFETVQRRQEQRRLLTFDDMLYLALRILIDRPDFRRGLQARFEFVLVDEYQDLNQAQLWLMRILAAPQNNLFVVGDDDQMIYGWRGAQVDHILNFNQYYPGAPLCVLQTNYRSARSVIRHSKRLIRHNTRRVDKDIQARPDAPEGGFDVAMADDLLDQAERAVQWILQTKNAQRLNWRHFAVLYRYHVYQFPMALILDRYQIPHTPVRMERLFQTPPGRDVASYLSVILHPEQARREDYQRILKRPLRYFTNEVIYPVSGWNELTRLPDAFKRRGKPDKAREAQRLIADIVALQNKARTGTFRAVQILNAMESRFQLAEFYRRTEMDAYERDLASDDIIYDVIQSTAELYDDVATFYAMIRSADGLSPSGSDTVKDPPDGIIMTTIHRTKGNEYPYVVYYNLSDRRRQSDVSPEEERRVCYVGVTRAIQGIFITGPEEKPSAYLPELLFNPEFRKYSDSMLRRQFKTCRQAIAKEESKIEKAQWRCMVAETQTDIGKKEAVSIGRLKASITEAEQTLIRLREIHDATVEELKNRNVLPQRLRRR